MVVPHIPKKSVIAVYDDKDKILPMTIYDFIEQHRFERFYVCNVLENDFEIMKNQILYGYLDERDPYKKECAYNKYRYLLVNDISTEKIRIANCDSDDFQGAYYIDKENTLCFDEKMVPFHRDYITAQCARGIKVYTTESFQDIINHFKNVNIDTLDQGIVPKRELK